MPLRPWTRRLVRVGSTLSSAAVLAAWVGSMLGSARCEDEPYSAGLDRGVLEIVYLDLSGFTVSHCGGGMPIEPLPSCTVGGVRFEYGHYYDEPVRWRPRFVMKDDNFVAAIVPLWLPLTPLVAVAGVANARALRQRRHARANACAACGYSLAGLTLGVPCPECGTPPR